MRTAKMGTLLLLTAVSVGLLCAQQNGKDKPDPRNAGERLVAVVPMVGRGTLADPIRPLFTPVPPTGRQIPIGQDGRLIELPEILGFRYELSDDKKTALLEIIGRDDVALKEIRESRRSDVKVFELGKATKGEIENEFRKYKPSFSADKFGVAPAPVSAPAGGGK